MRKVICVCLENLEFVRHVALVVMQCNLFKHETLRTRVLREKSPRQRTRAKNELNLQMTTTLGLELGPRW